MKVRRNENKDEVRDILTKRNKWTEMRRSEEARCHQGRRVKRRNSRRFKQIPSTVTQRTHIIYIPPSKANVLSSYSKLIQAIAIVSTTYLQAYAIVSKIGHPYPQSDTVPRSQRAGQWFPGRERPLKQLKGEELDSYSKGKGIESKRMEVLLLL